jgi:cardiolipin synthase
MTSQAATSKQYASIPNLLTYGRIAAVPLLAAALVVFPGDTGRWIAAGLFAAASITDFLDGYLARRLKQQSALGRMLDPIADKLLVGITLLMLVYDGTLSGVGIWAALIILGREIVVSGLREFLAELNVLLHVSWLAKWKTVVQMVALFGLLVGPALDPLLGTDGVLLWGASVLLWIAAALTLYTGFDYLKAAVRHAL